MKKKPQATRGIRVVFAMGIILSLGGCSTKAGEHADSIPKEMTAQEEPEKADGIYPLTITTYDSDGSLLQTTYKKAPQRVLAVYQGSIETMLELGLEDHLIATAGLDNEVLEGQKEAFSKTNYLDEFTPSLETVTMLQPDMIFSWNSLFGEKTLGSGGEWVEKGVNIYTNTNTRPNHKRTLENEWNDILNIGKIFDVEDSAKRIVEEMKDIVSQVEEEIRGRDENPSVLIIEPVRDSFTNYGINSLGGDMVTTLGGVLAKEDTATIGKEDVIVANPDVIFIVYMPYTEGEKDSVEQAALDVIFEDEAYNSLDAVQNGRVVSIMLSEMYASATRTKDGIITFAKGLYEE